MPLTAVSGLPVPQKPQIDGQSTMISVPWYPYDQSEWCWAACAQMIAFYSQQVLTQQCEIASDLFSTENCCQAPESYNKPIALPDFEKVLASIGKSGNFVPAPVQAEDIRTEIMAGRPLVVGYSWTTGGYHLAVIAGFSEDPVGPLVYINDPDPDFACGWIYYSNLQLAYGYGSWQWTWISIQ